MQYLLEVQSHTEGTFTFLLEYNENGDLVKWENRDLQKPLTSLQGKYLWNLMPVRMELIARYDDVKHMKFRELDTDLSFDAFWNLYNYKLGNKKRVQAKWKKLDDSEKVIVMKKVREYNFYLANNTIGKVFAEKFLSEKRYENDFTVK